MPYSIKGEQRNTGRTHFKKGGKPGMGMLGREHSEETKTKMRGMRKNSSGSNHYSWNPDRESVRRNNEYRNNGEYKIWSKSIKDRDGWRCQITDENCVEKVVAHHILGWALFPELRYKINNGITLCQFHHPRKRVDEVKLSPYFQELVRVKMQ